MNVNKKLVRCENCNMIAECEFVSGFGFLCQKCASGIKTAIRKYQKRCYRCGYEWLSDVENPKRCANCRSPYWNVPKKETLFVHRCFRCKHEWNSAIANPVFCPKCKSPYWNQKRKLIRIYWNEESTDTDLNTV